MADNGKDIDWAAVVRQGVETQELDYKAAQDWVELSRAGRAKFARHAMALANTRGGYIVVGVGEDANGNPNQFTGLSEKQLKSFDPSAVGQTVNRYADPSVDFDIVRPEVDGRFYAIFVVRPFRELPHVCSDTCTDELQRGVFYIRTPDARSRAAYRASEVHELVQRALRNQRQLLGRMLRGILYEGGQALAADDEREFRKQLSLSQSMARTALGLRDVKSRPVLELAVYPDRFFPDRIPLRAIREAAATIYIPPRSGFPFATDENHSHATNHGFRCTNAAAATGTASPLFFWQFYDSGLLHYTVFLTTETEASAIPFTRLLDWIGAAVYAVAQLYSELALDEKLLTLNVTLENTENAVLEGVASESGGSAQCFIPEVRVVKQRTVADLLSGPATHAAKILRALADRFNADPAALTAAQGTLRSLLGE
jgi:hypothetical protein